MGCRTKLHIKKYYHVLAKKTVEISSKIWNIHQITTAKIFHLSIGHVRTFPCMGRPKIYQRSLFWIKLRYRQNRHSWKLLPKHPCGFVLCQFFSNEASKGQTGSLQGYWENEWPISIWKIRWFWTKLPLYLVKS